MFKIIKNKDFVDKWIRKVAGMRPSEKQREITAEIIGRPFDHEGENKEAMEQVSKKSGFTDLVEHIKNQTIK